MELKIISFNIRCCDDKDGNSIAERAPRLFTVTSQYNADIIGFQEYRPAWEPYVENFYSADYETFLKYRNLTEDIEASPILWRREKFDCLKTGYFWLSDTPEVESRGWDERYNCYRMCVYAVLREKKSKKVFTVMNTHFGFGDDGQVKSADLIYRYSKKISENPTFIVGDFNMTPKSAGYAEMTRNFKDLNALTAKDMRSTFHNYKPEEITDEHIDYCFISEGIKPINRTLITDTVAGKYPSDHFGLFIKLSIY